jgi:rhodanese-related sulfurtransferase
MSVKRVLPKEAVDLLQQGWAYVDVRSVPEFEAGHPTGAYNVPLMHFMPGRGMSPNPDFMAVFAKHFPRDAKVVVGCKTAGRSFRAAELLAANGWASVVDMRGGFEGERDATGQSIVAGWRESGLPVESTGPAERTWEGLRK